MAPDAENYRAINAERLLSEAKDITVDKLIKEVGYSHYLSAFEILLPPIFVAYNGLPASDSLKQILKEPISLLQAWDRNSSVSSVAATLAIEWASRGIGDVRETVADIPRPIFPCDLKWRGDSQRLRQF